MGSLEKVTTEETLAKWAEDVRKRLDSDEPVAYVTEPKIDGRRSRSSTRTVCWFEVRRAVTESVART